MASAERRSPKPSTVLDALEEFLGDKPVRRNLELLSIPELDAIAESLGEFWQQQADLPSPDDASLIGGWRSAYGSEPALRADLSDSLLYYPRLLLLDPLADYLSNRSALPAPHGIRFRRPDGRENTVQTGAQIWSRAGSYESFRADPSAAASRFAAIVDNLYALEQPIRTGVTVLRSQWPILERTRTQLDTALRHDVASGELQNFVASIPPNELGLTGWDNLQGAMISMNGPIRPTDEKWRAEPYFYYVDKMLAVADAYGAQYVPASEQDLGLLRLKASGGLRRLHPEAMLHEVSRLVAPSVEVPIRQAAKIRESSADFNDWRSALRRIEREASGDTADELRERVEDELQPRINQVRRDLKQSSLGKLVRTDGVNLVIDGALGLTTGLLTHEALWGLAAGSTSGVVQWIIKAYSRSKPSGADAVLATLLRDPR